VSDKVRSEWRDKRYCPREKSGEKLFFIAPGRYCLRCICKIRLDNYRERFRVRFHGTIRANYDALFSFVYVTCGYCFVKSVGRVSSRFSPAL